MKKTALSVALFAAVILSVSIPQVYAQSSQQTTRVELLGGVGCSDGNIDGPPLRTTCSHTVSSGSSEGTVQTNATFGSLGGAVMTHAVSTDPFGPP